MAGYPTPPGDFFAEVAKKLSELQSQLRDLQRPSGTNIGSLVGQVQTLVAEVKATLADIDVTVASAINAYSMTTAAIQSLVANPPAGSTITGNLSATGSATVGGVLTADAGMSSTDIRNRLLSSGYVSVYADSSGRLGYVPSSLAVKTIIGPYKASLEDWLAVDGQIFYYNADENKTPRVGFIAEWVNRHFPEFVVHDAVEGEEGTHPAGLHYEFMIAGMQSAFQQFVAEQRAETKSLKDRLDALEA